jgi:Fic family protein
MSTGFMRFRGTKPDTARGFQPGYRLTPAHRDAIERIQRLDGALGASRLHPDFLESLRRRAATLNTHATTSLEGNPLSEGDVEEIASAPQRRLEAPEAIEIQNHLRYHAGLARSAPRERLGPSEMLDTHRVLLQGVLPSGVGSFKLNPNVITDAEGREIFHPTPPDRVVGELGSLLSWFDATPLPTPARIAIWVHEFLSLHPFRDGNGRTGRALTHRLFLATGFSAMKYVALDSQFLANRTAYMDAIRSVQTDAWDHAAWVAYFLECLERAYQDAATAVSGQARLVGELDGLSRELIEWVLARGGNAFSRADFLSSPQGKAYHDVSVSHVLTKLVQAEFLVADGSGKARRYRPGRRFRELVS